MKNQEIKFKNKNQSYSVIIGENTLKILPEKIKLLCPKTKKIALIVDRNIPAKFKGNLKKTEKKMRDIKSSMIQKLIFDDLIQMALDKINPTNKMTNYYKKIDNKIEEVNEIDIRKSDSIVKKAKPVKKKKQQKISSFFKTN